MAKGENVKEEVVKLNKDKEDNSKKDTDNNKAETTSLVMGLIACIFSFLGILILPLSIIGLVKGIKCNGNSGTKVAAIIFNALSILLEIVVMLFIVVMIGIFKFTFRTIDSTVDKIKDMTEEKEYDYNYGDNGNYTEDFSSVPMGNDKFGYLKIPNSWNFEIIEDDDSVRILSKRNSDDEISLEIISDSETLSDAYAKLFVKLVKAGNSINMKETIISEKYPGYYIESWGGKDNLKLYNIYLFQTEDNVFRTITISSYNADNKIFDVYNTYSLKEQQ